MKKFKYKLDALLKLKEFNEKKIKVELGEILKEIQLTEDRIEKLNRDIDEAYGLQGTILSGEAKGEMLQFIPYFIQGKKQDILNTTTVLNSLKKRYELKLEELRSARGEVKVLENHKDKEKTDWRKEVDKWQMQQTEEIVLMRDYYKKEMS